MAHPSKYRAMWLFVMFDLPTDTKAARKRYSIFRSHLLDEGFDMIQYSVYVRYCSSERRANKYRKSIQTLLPAEGEVRIMAMTDAQYGAMHVYQGQREINVEKPPEQLTFL